MSSRGLNILDALDNLNTLIDVDSLAEIEVTEDAHLIAHKEERQGEGEEYWVKAGADDQTLDAVKTTFRSVYDYLQTFYQKMKKSGDTKRLVEGINTIMVLVGEAAKKMDRFGSLFSEKVSNFKEYKELQNFYRNKVIKESFKEFAKTTVPKEEVLPEDQDVEEEILELLGEEEAVEEVEGVHILNDISVVKKDHLYELFYLKNEAGHRFYTYELSRNLKLACDFGVYANGVFVEDPLLQIKNWEDKSLNIFALTILKKSRDHLNKFYAEAMKYKEMDLVKSLHNACMALMLASNTRNLIRQFSLKGCHLYFADFLLFLRETLQNREFQKFLSYPPPASKPFFQDVMNLIQFFCGQLYTTGPDRKELNDALKKLIDRFGPAKEKELSSVLHHANFALNENLSKHPNGPIFKALDIIREEDEERSFDPISQGSLPGYECALDFQEKEIKVLRLPCPTLQQWITKAYVSEEFKEFLRGLDKTEHLLFINFQDRTSWKEHARCEALEEISRHAEFADCLTVVTLAKDTDFYNQTGVYEEMDDAKEFKHQFIQHLRDESTGYYFSPQIKGLLFPDFIDNLIFHIHEVFFEKKDNLSYLERLDYIQIAYLFIELKLVEIVNPTLLTLSSKDALDLSATGTIGLIAFLSLPKDRIWKSSEIDQLNTILFGPTLMSRERAIHPELFDRLYAMIHLLESKKNYLKPFSSLYKKGTLEYTVKL